MIRAEQRDLHRRLADHRRYRRQIEKLHSKYLFCRRLYLLKQDQVSLATVVMHRRKVARLLARAVERGAYRLSPAEIRVIRTDGKERSVYSFGITDLIVHGVVAEIIEESIAPAMTSSLYSYRKGVSWRTPVSRFAAYVRAHRKSHPAPRTRGLYVLRRDVDSYTDSIPVGGTSPIWQQLRGVLESDQHDARVTPDDWSMIEKVVRPEVRLHGGATCSNLRGVPTGQPISCVLFNMYLMKLDQELDRIPGGFYARYSDDIIFAHRDCGIAQEVDRRIVSILKSLGLTVKPSKSRNLYLNGAGRPSTEWPAARGATHVPFLGCSVAATGTVGLARQKYRGFLRDIERRAFRTVRALGDADTETAGRAVCAVINRAVRPHDEVFQSKSSPLLRFAVTDRSQLKGLDYSLARIVVRAVTGSTSVKGFRAVPYRRIREGWGLRSVLHSRNHVR